MKKRGCALFLVGLGWIYLFGLDAGLSDIYFLLHIFGLFLALWGIYMYFEGLKNEIIAALRNRSAADGLQ